MTQTAPASRRPNGVHTAGHRQRAWPPWDGTFTWRRGALTMVALSSILVLLAAFVLAAQESVRVGELRRARVKAQAEATWLCNVMAAPRQRTACLHAIDEAADAAMGATLASN